MLAQTSKISMPTGYMIVASSKEINPIRDVALVLYKS
jgi:hypothetical protein